MKRELDSSGGGDKEPSRKQWSLLGWLGLRGDSEIPDMPLAEATLEKLIADNPELVKHAQKLADFARLNYVVGTGYPVDTTKFARQLGFAIDRLPLNEEGLDPDAEAWVSGAMIKEVGNRAPAVYVNSADSAQQQRFTKAHEIGHYLAMSEGKSVEEITADTYVEKYCPNRGNPQSYEFLADTIAYHILMPHNAVDTLRAQGATLEEMANRFGVSPAAMKLRMVYFRTETVQTRHS
jgi:hypothetical protein